MGRHDARPLHPSEQEAVREVLKRAAEGINTHGWVQGRGYEDGKRCITNAIGTSAMEVDEMLWMDLASAAAKAVMDDLKLGTGTLMQWNDAGGRTQDDVVETLKRVASQL